MKPSIDRWLMTSLMDTDLYKITMLQAFYHAPEFRTVDVEWKFACRERNGFNLAELIPDILHQLEHLCSLSFRDDELDYLAKFSFFKPDFIEFLRVFRLDMRFVSISPKGEDIDLRFRGPLLHVTLFEIYALAIISELHTLCHCTCIDLDGGRKRLHEKIALLKSQDDLSGFSFADFGTRRRSSKAWQKEVLLTLKNEVPQYFSGTSNLEFAHEMDLIPIGTMAHEWFQSWQAITRLSDAQKAALEGWVREYRVRLGVALTDCYSMDSFMRDFSDPYFGKLYDGLRHDSGSPFDWGIKALKMYEQMGIDPLTKTLVFSDSLTFPRMLEIYRYFKDRTKVSFGIGTDLTNDTGCPALNMVIKQVAADGRPVAKISDEPGKSMCEDPQYLSYLASVYGIDDPVGTK